MPRKDVNFYLTKGQELLKTKHDLLIFTEGPFVDKILKMSENRPKDAKTIVVDYPFQNLTWYPELEEITKRFNQGKLVNASKDKDTPAFNVLMRGKFDFLREAKKYLDQGKWEHLFWIDFGLAYVAADFHLLDEIQPSSLIKVQCIRPIYQEELDTSFFTKIMGTRSGGLWCIPIPLLNKFINLFNKVASITYGIGLIPLEDSILTYMTVLNPELFEYYYMDYCDIVRNFDNQWHRGDFGILHLGVCCAMRHPESREYRDLQGLVSRTLEKRSFGSENDSFLRNFIKPSK